MFGHRKLGGIGDRSRRAQEILAEFNTGRRIDVVLSSGLSLALR